MLHAFAIKNFLSFKERNEVSFRLTAKAKSHGWDEKSSSGQRLATAMAVVGANAAGKTSLIKPLAFLNWFTTNSFLGSQPSAQIPVKPHFSTPDEPIEFEVEADDKEGTLWRYVLKLSPDHVLHEAVYRKPNKKGAKFSYLFVREWDESEKEYSVKQEGFGLNPVEAKKVRPNASLISTAAQYGVEAARHLMGTSVSSNLLQFGRLSPEVASAHASIFFNGDKALKEKMESLLHDWDLGLSGVVIREVDFPSRDLPFKIEIKPPEGVKVPTPRQLMTLGIHALKDGSRHEIPWTEESSGTKTAFITLWYLLSALSTGGVAVIDELESDMHPRMIEPLLDLFASPKTNPYKAQIIFTSHSVEVMNLLGKSQVLLVEKTDCESEAWRLDSMEGVRSQDNLYAKYMSGAYGAVPQM